MRRLETTGSASGSIYDCHHNYDCHQKSPIDRSSDAGVKVGRLDSCESSVRMAHERGCLLRPDRDGLLVRACAAIEQHVTGPKQRMGGIRQMPLGVRADSRFTRQIGLFPHGEVD